MQSATGDGPSSRQTAEGVTNELCEWLACMTDEEIPSHVRERAAHILLDGIGCGLIGAQLPWSQAAVGAMTSVEPPGDHILIGWDRRVSAQAAAVLNGTFIQGFELDDYHPLAPLHSCSLVIPSLLATAHDIGEVSGRRFLTAAILGFEVGPRAGLGLHGSEMLSRGWHSGSVFGTHASAAAAGYLRGLSASQFEDALGLAGTQSAGLMAAQYEAMSKRMHHGFSSRAGYYAAVFAAHGYTGIKAVFERDYGGWLSTFGEGHDPDQSAIVAELGERWETERITLKAFASMAGLHAAIDGTLDARASGLRADDVERIDVTVSRPTYHHGWWVPTRPLTAVGAQMNIGYAISVALLDGAVLARQFTAAKLDDDSLWNLIERVNVHVDDSFDSTNGSGRYRTDLVFTTKSGDLVERQVMSPPGGVGRALTNAQLREKFATLTDGILSERRRDRIESFVLGMDDMSSISELAEELSGSVANALA